jgi:hypothetical protein
MSPDPNADPVKLADRDVRRLLPPAAGLQDPVSLRPRLAALLETLYQRLLVAEAEAARAIHMVAGHEKAYALLLAGMESSEEQRTALKLRVRELEATP